MIEVPQPGKWEGWGSNQASELTPHKPHIPLSKIGGEGCLSPVQGWQSWNMPQLRKGGWWTQQDGLASFFE